MTSIKTVGNPNKAEKATQRVFDKMTNITDDALNNFAEARKVPAPTYSSYLTAKEENDWSYAVKPIYDHTKSTNKAGEKFIDYNKPMRAYIKLLTKGKGKKIQCDTMIYGPGDKKLSPWKCMGVHGSCQLVVKWDGIFWGAHGRNSYGASICLKAHEMIFTPGVLESAVPSRRMLAPVEEKEEDVLKVPESDDVFKFN